MINLQALYLLLEHFGADIDISEDNELTVSYFGGGIAVMHISALSIEEVQECIIEDLKSRLKERYTRRSL